MKEGWEVKKLGDVCEILDYLRKPVTKKDRREGIYPYYGASGIVDHVAGYIFDEDIFDDKDDEIIVEKVKKEGIPVNENTVKEMIDMANYLGMDPKEYFGDVKLDDSNFKSSY